jgi:hypothetical protein
MGKWAEEGEAPDNLDAYGTTAPPFNYIAHPLDPDTVVTGRKTFPYPSLSIYDAVSSSLVPIEIRT